MNLWRTLIILLKMAGLFMISFTAISIISLRWVDVGALFDHSFLGPPELRELFRPMESFIFGVLLLFFLTPFSLLPFVFIFIIRRSILAHKEDETTTTMLAGAHAFCQFVREAVVTGDLAISNEKIHDLAKQLKPALSLRLTCLLKELIGRDPKLPSFPPLSQREKIEVILDKKMPLIVIVMRICSIFLFAWALLSAFAMQTPATQDLRTLYHQLFPYFLDGFWIAPLMIWASVSVHLFFTAYSLSKLHHEQTSEHKMDAKQREEIYSLLLETIDHVLSNMMSQPGVNVARVLEIARALTVMSLVDLNAEYKGKLLALLYQHGLIVGCTKLPLAGFNFQGADLTGVNMSNASLEKIDLKGANLENADLSNAKMMGADLVRARLTSACLKNADLSKANLEGAVFYQSNLENAVFSGADLRQVNMHQAKTDGAVFDEPGIV